VSPFASDFIDGVIDHNKVSNAYETITGKIPILRLLFADDVGIGPFAVNSLHKGKNQVVKYCINWSWNGI
jgi:hypothetical protein